jgi:hypothetical protein
VVFINVFICDENRKRHVDEIEISQSIFSNEILKVLKRVNQILNEGNLFFLNFCLLVFASGGRQYKSIVIATS